MNWLTFPIETEVKSVCTNNDLSEDESSESEADDSDVVDDPGMLTSSEFARNRNLYLDPNAVSRIRSDKTPSTKDQDSTRDSLIANDIIGQAKDPTQWLAEARDTPVADLPVGSYKPGKTDSTLLNVHTAPIDPSQVISKLRKKDPSKLSDEELSDRLKRVYEYQAKQQDLRDEEERQQKEEQKRKRVEAHHESVAKTPPKKWWQLF